MFLLRSAFWLGAAYLVLAPHAGSDIGDAAQAVSQAAPRIAAAGLSSLPCDSLECAAALGALESVGQQDAAGPAATLPVAPVAATDSAAALLMDAAVASQNAPVPPQRPAWAS